MKRRAGDCLLYAANLFLTLHNAVNWEILVEQTRTLSTVKPENNMMDSCTDDKVSDVRRLFVCSIIHADITITNNQT